MTDENKVVTIKGGKVGDPRNPNPRLISSIENILQMAKDGEITGIAGVYICFDDSTGSFNRGDQSMRMVGSLSNVQWNMLKSMNDD